MAGRSIFTSDPSTGGRRTFPEGTPEDIDRTVRAAEEAFWSFDWSSRAERAAFLDRTVDEIDARVEVITEIGSLETGLPPGRLESERGRTTAQLRVFARHIEKCDHLDRRHVPALPDRNPAPRPDLRLIQRPIGPSGSLARPAGGGQGARRGDRPRLGCVADHGDRPVLH